MELLPSFGLWLKERRKRLDLTQADLADRVGCSVMTIRKIEADERRPSRQMAELLADCLRITQAERPTFLKVARAELRADRLPQNVQTLNVDSLPAPLKTNLPTLSTPPTALRAGPDKAPPPHNLPFQATPFIGRAAALDGLQRRLADPEVRLITIIGPGGMGKTRLALALAERELQPTTAFPDGIYFISLAPISSAEVMAQTIAEGVAFSLSSAQEPAVQLLTYLRHKHMLLVLDNFEHVLAGVELVNHILQSAAGVKVLATSRERLNLTYETLWPISGLSLAEFSRVEEALTCDAVQLFVQRARRVQPDFVLPAEALPHLEHILRVVGGMPLAIELAAAWLNMLSLAEIAAELGRGLDLLESKLRDAPGRHRSMRLVFDRSWERLEGAEQELFKKLSIFRGGFTREAAQQVAGASLQLLAGLVNKSLLTSQPDRGRYELHELLRQYAAEYLQQEAQLEQATRDRHSDYYLTLLQTREPALRSSRQKEALAELNADLDNIRLAWDTAVAHQAVERLHGAAFPLWYFYNLRDSLREGESAFRRAAEMVQARLALLDPQQASPERAQLEGALGEFLSHQAQFTFRQGRNVEAATLYQTSLTLLRPLNEPAALGQALTYCGVVCWIAGEFDQAWPYLNEGLSIVTQVGDKWLQAQTRTFMGMVSFSQGDYAGAYTYLNDSMSQARTLADPRLMSVVAGQLSRAAQSLGRMSEVLDLLREILRLTTETGDRLGIGVTLEQMSIAMHANGDEAEARWLLQESIEQFRDVGDSWFLSHALNLAGHFALSAGDEAQARDSFRQAGQIAAEAQALPNMLDALAGLAIISEQTGRLETALEMTWHILQHPASTQDAKDRAEKLRASLTTQLSPQQVEAVQVRAQTKSFEVVKNEVLM